MTRVPEQADSRQVFLTESPDFPRQPGGEGRAATRLENYANSSSPQRSRRTERHLRRQALWHSSSLSRVRKCGRTTLGTGVQIRHRDGIGAGFSGLATCGSVWVCPCCSARILAHRQDEVRAAIAAYMTDAPGGRQLAMLTLTMRHRKGQPLRELWDSLGYAWASVTSGKGWQTSKAKYGLEGWLRVVELTHGANGWHVHVHALLFVDGGDRPALTAADTRSWRSELTGRWSRALERRGLSPALERAQELHLVTGRAEPLADYFTKQADTGTASRGASSGIGGNADPDEAHAIAQEFTRSAGKASRAASGGRSTWRILDGVIAGDSPDTRLWHEYEKASRGRRQMTWSKGLRDQLGLNDDRTDESIADEEIGDRSEALCQVVDCEPRPVTISDSPEIATPPGVERRKPQTALITIIVLGVAMALALGALIFYHLQLQAANDLIVNQNNQIDDKNTEITEQQDLIDRKETFGAAMTGLLEKASEFDGVLMASLVPFDDYQYIATQAWEHRRDPESLASDTETVVEYTDDLTALLTAAATEAGSNTTGSTYETVTDQLGGGFVASLVDDADSICKADVLACVFSDDPFVVHFDAADASVAHMTDWLKTGVAYHEFAHVLQMTNPEPTEIALDAFGGDEETMADCFALTYLDGWALDQRVYINSYTWWEVSIGYGHTCDEPQRQAVRDWYGALGFQSRSITQ